MPVDDFDRKFQNIYVPFERVERLEDSDDEEDEDDQEDFDQPKEKEHHSRFKSDAEFELMTYL